MSLINRCLPKNKLFRGLGFTLVELMITVAIVSIVAAIGVPSFQEMLRQNSATSLANELATSFNLARSEAIKRGTLVSVCKSGNVTDASPTCSTTASWQDGWLIFEDKGTAGTFDTASDTRIKIWQPSSNSAAITGDTTFADYIAYHPSGMSKGSGLPNGSFHICVDGAKRKLTISATGRIRFIKETC
jgi:type IV fimbrial biogenesis protein FimT